MAVAFNHATQLHSVWTMPPDVLGLMVGRVLTTSARAAVFGHHYSISPMPHAKQSRENNLNSWPVTRPVKNLPHMC